MGNISNAGSPASQDAKQAPNVVDVGAWLTSVKSIRRQLADYVPRHRAAGPAV